MRFIPFLSIWLLASIIAILINMFVSRKVNPKQLGRNAALCFAVSIFVSMAYFILRLTGLHNSALWLAMNNAFRIMFFIGPVLFVISFLVSSLVMFIISQYAGQAYRVSMASVCLLTLGLGLPGTGYYMHSFEPNWIQVTNLQIRTSKLKSGSQPIKILQMSDTHLEDFGTREYKALSIVFKEKPDIVVLTGDYVNSWDKADLMRRFASDLRARYGIYAVSGNWNWNPDLQYEKFFKGTDVKLLDGKSVTVPTDSGSIAITGVSFKNAQSGNFSVPHTRNYSILLSHTPDASMHLKSGVDLLLAGHTHGGQIRIPGLGPLVTLSRVKRNRAAGLSHLNGGGLMYVNRGLGMEGGNAPRIRFFCRPEITVITLLPK